MDSEAHHSVPAPLFDVLVSLLVCVQLLGEQAAEFSTGAGAGAGAAGRFVSRAADR